MTGPERISNERLLAVAALFALTVGATALVGTVLPGTREAAGVAIAACIAVYAGFGAVIVRRAGRRP